MREHHLYALSDDSTHYHQKRLAEAARNRLAAEATAAGTSRRALRMKYLLAALSNFFVAMRAGGFDGVICQRRAAQ